MEFRIVELRKGDCAVGFRVQQHAWSRGHGQYVWRNRGRVCFSVDHARMQLDWLIRQAAMAKPATEFVVVE